LDNLRVFIESFLGVFPPTMCLTHRTSLFIAVTIWHVSFIHIRQLNDRRNPQIVKSHSRLTQPQPRLGSVETIQQQQPFHTLSRIFNRPRCGPSSQGVSGLHVIPGVAWDAVSFLRSQRKVKGKTGLTIISVVIVYTDKARFRAKVGHSYL
jgi:hypothetical protein